MSERTRILATFETSGGTEWVVLVQYKGDCLSRQPNGYRLIVRPQTVANASEAAKKIKIYFLEEAKRFSDERMDELVVSTKSDVLEYVRPLLDELGYKMVGLKSMAGAETALERIDSRSTSGGLLDGSKPVPGVS